MSEPPRPVIVTDIRMHFGSMVTFMVKWALAAVPALVILIVLCAMAVDVVRILIQQG